MNKSALVIGGLGFIGYHIVKTLHEAGYKVSIGSRSKSESQYTTVPIINIDLDNMKDSVLESVLEPFRIIIFAGGVDDRNIPSRNQKNYFYKGNVVPCVRLAEMSRILDIEHIVILGSYFSYFDRKQPEWKMSEKHPYIKSRLLQRIETQEASDSNTQVSCLEIPYVFGASPGSTPLWKPLINYIASSPIVFYTNGGTNICAVEQVAAAIRGILKSTELRNHWIVGGDNVSWKKMIAMIASALGKKRKVIIVPDFMVKLTGAIAKFYFSVRGKFSGLDAYYFMETQVSETYLDTKESMHMLEYKKMDMDEAIRQ
ncbi:MAG: NAD(P)-dependent oxidoreductase, partial [Saprospiraceae bacterium]|nr:NAD(P)-dependent oxidoreductase [Saprospiraceae bacterium]